MILFSTKQKATIPYKFTENRFSNAIRLTGMYKTNYLLNALKNDDQKKVHSLNEIIQISSKHDDWNVFKKWDHRDDQNENISDSRSSQCSESQIDSKGETLKFVLWNGKQNAAKAPKLGRTMTTKAIREFKYWYQQTSFLKILIKPIAI